MAVDKQISDLTTLTPVDNTDWVAVVDVSDTTDGAGGTTKKAARSEFKGDTGAAGADGADGADGRSLIWEGPWLTATAYQVDDLVSINGNSYICIVAHTSGTFATDLAAAKWQLVAQKGDTGATGATGATGSQGPAGNDGVVQTVVAGANISVDNTDPANPVVSASGGDIAATIHAAASKATPVDADELGLVDSAASNVLKKLTWANLKATLNAIYDWATVAHAASSKTTPVDADELSIVDSASSNVIKKLTWANLKATLKTYFDTLYQAAGSGGGGFVFKSYTTATGAASITVSGLDLNTDGEYLIKVESNNGSADADIQMQINATTGGHQYANQSIEFNGAASNNNNGGNGGGDFFPIANEITRRNFMSQIEVGRTYNGTTFRPFFSWNTAGYLQGSSKYSVQARGAGANDTASNLTSLKFQLSSGTANWKVWVLKRATS